MIVQLELQGLELLAESAGLASARERLCEHAATLEVTDVLPKVADGHPLGTIHEPVIRMLLVGDHAEDRALPATVGADQADLLAVADEEGRVDEEELATVLLGDVRKGDHRNLERLLAWAKGSV